MSLPPLCAWCGLSHRHTNFPTNSKTHGICDECLERVFGLKPSTMPIPAFPIKTVTKTVRGRITTYSYHRPKPGGSNVR